MRRCSSLLFFVLISLFFIVTACRFPAFAFTMDEYKAAVKNPDKITELLIGGLDDADKITSIPAEIKKFKKLKKLYINNLKNLRKLPDEIGELTEMTELHLEQGNDSEPMRFELPESIGRLKNLKVLNLNGAFDLGKNPLPKSLSKLSNLEELDLGRCGVKELPAQIAEFASLKKLSLEYDPINVLPAFIAELQNLEELNLNYTGIKELPEGFINFKKLTVQMGNNYLKLIDQQKLSEKFKNISFSFENIYDDAAANEEPTASGKPARMK